MGRIAPRCTVIHASHPPGLNGLLHQAEPAVSYPGGQAAEIPGKPAESRSLLTRVAGTLGPAEPGSLGSTCYEVLDNPDVVVEIADWESAEARAAAMQRAFATGAYAPLAELLAAPFRATVVKQLN